MKSALLHTIALACLVFVTTHSAAVLHGSTNDFCHGLDCPHFTVLNKTKDWELRRYGEYKWAATNSTGIDRDSTNSKMFRILFNYISGENEKHVKIPMTAPVLTKVSHGQGPTCASSFTMHFMIPLNQQDAPIAPTDPQVFIDTTPQVDVFVRTFGGYASEQDYLDNLSALSTDVASVSKVEGAYFFTAGYDGPYQFQNRHNEVWLVKV